MLVERLGRSSSLPPRSRARHALETKRAFGLIRRPVALPVSELLLFFLLRPAGAWTADERVELEHVFLAGQRFPTLLLIVRQDGIGALHCFLADGGHALHEFLGILPGG